MKRLFELTVDEFVTLLQQNTVSPSPSPDTDQDEWMSRADACKILKVSLPTLNTMLNQGKLHRYKVGRKTLISRDEVQQIIENGKV